MQGDIVRAKLKILEISNVLGAALTYNVGIDCSHSVLNECINALIEMVLPFPAGPWLNT